MQKSLVALIRCDGYEFDRVFEAIKKGVNLLGGIEGFIKKGENILIKPNLLAGREPDRAVTTHPAIFEAVVKLLLDNEINVTYGDSPGIDKPSMASQKSGLTEVAKKYNIKMGDFNSSKSVVFQDGVFGNKFEIASGVLDSDGIVNISKMKSHQLTRITGAVKNQFGCVYGFNKASYHVTHPNATHFCKMLVDLNRFIKSRLYIMDGIVAMEGNGPASGEPVKMNCILISSDPVAIDATFCRIVKLDPTYVPTNTYGQESGLGYFEEDKIEVVGDDLSEFINNKFDVVRKPIKDSGFLKKLTPFRNLLVARPVITDDLCERCGICVNACPVEGKALDFKNGNKKRPPKYTYEKCIRCYCCQEVCPYKAISVKIPFLGRLIGGR